MSALRRSIIGLFLIFGIIPATAHSQSGCVQNGIEVTISPSTPLQFQFFPMSLLGIGTSGSAGALTAGGLQLFGITFVRPTTDSGTGEINVRIRLVQGNRQLFERPLRVPMYVPKDGVPYFVSVPQFISGMIPDVSMDLNRTRFGRLGDITKARIDDKYANDLAGGMPSGNFGFIVETAPGGSGNYAFCGTIQVEVATGATVDLITPANNSETSNLPFFQWAAVGGEQFILTLARVNAGQSFLNALNTSSQRAIIELSNTRSYQTTAGGPANARENNLIWNPGLTPGQYVYQITMIQTDPITASQNLVPSAIHAFVVSGSGKENLSGLNTQEIINILSSKIHGYDLENIFKGYNAVSLEINGTSATVEDLRAKVNNLPKSFKVDIKP